MIPVMGETYNLELFKRKENSPYEYEENPLLYFRGRPANQMEKEKYRILRGVNGNSDSILVMCSNLPNGIEINDRIKFLGKVWTISNIGYYLDNNLVVNAAIFSDKYIMDRCPKGLTLQ